MSTGSPTPAFAAVQDLATRQAHSPIADMFSEDAERVTRFTRRAAGLHLATDKQRWTPEALKALYAWAEERNLLTWRDQLFSMTPVNITEGRAAGHTALRSNGVPAAKKAAETRARLKTLVDSARSGALLGQPVEAIVNIGVGGSGLGPKLVVNALKGPDSLPTTFAANVDGAELQEALKGLNPATTLVVLVSKTFTTLETMMNAEAVRSWFMSHLGEGALAKHCVAATAAPERAEAWGLSRDNIFPFWDWVGGRFSLWSAAGMAIPLSLGWAAFDELLQGAEVMDTHVRDTDLEDNMAVHLALLDAWNRLLGASSRAVVPYASRLAYLPGFLQQLEMESNGKGVTTKNVALEHPACPVVWGDVGTTGQHAFFQMLHQGLEKIPVEFILVANSRDGHDGHQKALLANGLAQGAALLRGKSKSKVREELKAKGYNDQEIEHLTPHMVFEGDRPSTTLILDRLTPKRLGALLALYEHKTALLGRLWGINPFDQFGVELGKQMARTLTPRLEGARDPAFDPSTEALLKVVTDMRQHERQEPA